MARDVGPLTGARAIVGGMASPPSAEASAPTSWWAASGAMCDHCGCRQLTPIARLMSEHDRLRELTAFIRHELATGDHAGAQADLRALLVVLGPHTESEEHGLFPKLRAHEEFAEPFAAALATLDGPDWDDIDDMDPGAHDVAAIHP